jgi:hypothetical protein
MVDVPAETLDRIAMEHTLELAVHRRFAFQSVAVAVELIVTAKERLTRQVVRISSEIP